jgi:hypothetical protein
VNHIDSASNEQDGERVGEGRPATLSERRLEERAIRQGWPIGPQQRQDICDRLMGVIHQEADTAPLRYVVQAAKALMTADRLTLEHHKQQRRAGADAEPLEDLTDDAELRARSRRRQRAGTPG